MRLFKCIVIAVLSLHAGFGFSNACSNQQYTHKRDKVEFIKTYSSSDIKAVLPELARVVGNDGAHVYRVTYEAKAPNGSVVLLSGSLIRANRCEKLAPVIVYHHGTIINDSEAPSVSLNYGLLEASHGYDVLVPDYFGYGASKEMLHPYLIEQYYGIAAKGMLDVYGSLLEKNNFKMGKLFVSGYSEGGYGALATVKYFEANPAFGYRIVAAAPAAGPYDLLATGLKLLQVDRTNPLNTAFLISAYGNYYADEIDHKKILKEIVGVNYSTVFNENVSYSYLSKKLPFLVDELLYPEFRQNFLVDATNYMKNKAYPASSFIKKLSKNSIHCNWKPKTQIKFLHCEDDKTVPAFSSKRAYDCLSKSGHNVELEIIKSPENQKPYDHYNCPAIFTPIFYFNMYR